MADSVAAIYLCASSLQLLIKKGRGIWPDEALATNNVNWEGANSSPVIAGEDKSDNSFVKLLCNNKSPSDLQVGFLFAAINAVFNRLFCLLFLISFRIG